jgi:TusE/DsrC/DsvC family sulfur relay protein
MNILRHEDKVYHLDAEEFLEDFEEWDEDFAKEMAPRAKISGELTARHWEVINFIRTVFQTEGRCPLIYETCRVTKFDLATFEALFPTGHLRGACRLAGISYKEACVGRRCQDSAHAISLDKIYQVNALGFLIDPYQWDRQFAELKACELKMPDHLTEEHWQIIEYLRASYKKNYSAPSIFETCRDNEVTLDDMERLFPDGFRCGAVKIAGLRTIE